MGRAVPELPDVEGYRRVLAEHAVGRRVRQVRVTDSGVLHGVSPAGLDRALRDRRFTEPARHGKWLLAHTDGPTLLLHFGMTGSLHWAEEDQPVHRHDRVLVRTDGGELRYRDMRKLQGLRLAHTDDEVDRVLAELGPDAAAVDVDEFVDRLAARRRAAVKAVLTDQAVVAGLGNLLADEILWRAGVHPATGTGALDRARLGRLHREMRAVLARAVPAGRVPDRPGWLTGRRDDPTGACPRCGGPLARTRLAGRTTVWCPVCQPE
ncbi:Fpg/Nei family DNA glycosylase [Goodfellowiella coeruleoviolacea]|uniref:Formamidopyrimidine-DNA glycosylase n=1 Tax=Goodfellowiella coeruleoviolacea TaxID=334858 RepID=A0AAE3GI20_9PSEU|nr:DNA-formamidopyrimidine glycosylase family protein [Goodfellowiella coeruleoviolacea]MCP2166528.1 formamidopyrimidine-DNA glycosylase [Goodfellowiella coeruleoviolacea]